MNTYTVYFTIFDKKMRTKVVAKSKQEAWAYVQSKLTCIRIDSDSPNINNIFSDIFKF